MSDQTLEGPPWAIADWLRIPRGTVYSWVRLGKVAGRCEVTSRAVFVDYDHAIELRDNRPTRRKRRVFASSPSVIQTQSSYRTTVPTSGRTA